MIYVYAVDINEFTEIFFQYTKYEYNNTILPFHEAINRTMSLAGRLKESLSFVCLKREFAKHMGACYTHTFFFGHI